MKLPYDQMINRVLPRLLKTSIWSDPTAEPLLRQLLVPIRSSSSSTNGETDKMMVVPISDADCAHLGLPPGDENHLQPCGGAAGSSRPAEEVADSGDSEQSSHVQPLASPGLPLPKLPCIGLLQPTEYHALVGSFLRKALTRVVRDLTIAKKRQWGSRDRDCLCPPQMLRVLLRYVEAYMGSLSFTSVVMGGVLPLISLALEHPEDEVVLEALHAFSVAHRYVMNVFDRVKKYRKSSETGGVASTDDVLPVFGSEDPHQQPQQRQQQPAAVVEAAGDARKMVIGILVRNIFAVACCDRVPELRLLALTAAVKSLTCGAGGAWRHMPRMHAITALCCNIVLYRSTGIRDPHHPFALLRDQHLSDESGQTTAWLQISLRALRFTHKIIPHLAPVELTQDIVPAVATLLDRMCLTTARDLWLVEKEGKLTEVVQEVSNECTALLQDIFSQLAVGGPRYDQQEMGDGEEVGGEQAERHSVVVGSDGWCNVRDPVPFQSNNLQTLLGEVTSCSRSTVKRRNSSHATKIAVELGPWAGGLRLSADQHKSLPTFNFVDCDYELNAAGVLRPDHVAAEVIAAASATRTYVPSLKSHPLSMRLPSRQPPTSAPADQGSTASDGLDTKKERKRIIASKQSTSAEGREKPQRRSLRPAVPLDVIEKQLSTDTQPGASETTNRSPTITEHDRVMQHRESVNADEGGDNVPTPRNGEQITTTSPVTLSLAADRDETAPQRLGSALMKDNVMEASTAEQVAETPLGEEAPKNVVSSEQQQQQPEEESSSVVLSSSMSHIMKSKSTTVPRRRRANTKLGSANNSFSSAVPPGGAASTLDSSGDSTLTFDDL